jgi:hypothetical protein
MKVQERLKKIVAAGKCSWSKTWCKGTRGQGTSHRKVQEDKKQVSRKVQEDNNQVTSKVQVGKKQVSRKFQDAKSM